MALLGILRVGVLVHDGGGDSREAERIASNGVGYGCRADGGETRPSVRGSNKD